ncbi:hypothetical protein ACWGH8_20045 [Nonomuraea muscovyensis]|uniref:Uncharacterized protein n=1 Tax=Nonomuraea muscovyensis TaxID=1124761 RepID=A0A7X0C403_9ACTN|nr:hypothetical protein [Nonomuraea muscovyensis]MBB6348087.1 hypothetical protein [Nonomuraea muscovyensis]
MKRWVARMYPDPADEAVGVTRGDVFEVLDHDDVVAGDVEPRDHPEVPLSPAQRDAVLERLGYVRTGPWIEENERAEASVRPR